VAATLQGLAIGVPAWLLIGTLVRALYARGATARPFVMNVCAFVTVIGVGVIGTLVTNASGTGALRLLGSAIGVAWCVAAIAGFVLLKRLAPEWDVTDAARAFAINAVRAAVVGLVVWGVLRLSAGNVSPALTLALAVAAGGAVVAVGALRSAELRGTLAFLGRGVHTQEQL
jgi:peptidoglycan biosynthesis protein MviN/MurJ (putative lipid II flippase)